jgi:hypothetical protein
MAKVNNNKNSSLNKKRIRQFNALGRLEKDLSTAPSNFGYKSNRTIRLESEITRLKRKLNMKP